MKTEFYEKCSKILGIPYECKPFPWTHSNRTRWNNRAAGSGRYEGFGLIRVFGTDYHVATYTGSRIFKSEQEVFDFLTSYADERGWRAA